MKAALGAMALALAAAAFTGFGAPVAETDMPNWAAHVEPARLAHEADAAKPLRWVDHGGVVREGDTIRFAAADLDDVTARAVREAVTSGDAPHAAAAFFAAQGIAAASPEVSPALSAALARPGTRFVRVYLYDACFNDGDVVDLYLNDALIATVPLTNAGETLTLPVPDAGRARIVLRGRTDGGGGITVGCRTSQGDFFCRPMGEGEVQPIGIVGQ